MMLDSRSSVSLPRQDILEKLTEFHKLAAKKLQLVSAAGEPIPVIDHVAVPVCISELKVMQPFVVVAPSLPQLSLE